MLLDVLGDSLPTLAESEIGRRNVAVVTTQLYNTAGNELFIIHTVDLIYS